MQILAAYKAILLAVPAVVDLAPGGVWVATIGQGVVRPNILLNLTGEGQDYTHSGAVELFDAGINVVCRADTADAAGALGTASRKALQDYTGIAKKCWIQLNQHMSSMVDYDDGAKVFRHTAEYTAFFRRTD